MDQNLAKLNQARLVEAVGSEATVILFSGVAPKMSADMQYRFVVNRNFYYITGIDEPYLIYLLHKGVSYLFIERADELHEKWVGKKIDYLRANFKSGIENIYFLEDFYRFVYENIPQGETLYLDLETDQFNQHPTVAERQVLRFGSDYEIEDVYPILTKLRMIKSDLEIKEIKKAIAITKQAFENVMKNMVPDVRESHYEADFDYILKRYNVPAAFDSIVASGVNATILHYVTNNKFSKKGDLVLFDFGATSNLYCADISRTIPVTGKYSERQKEIYQIVLNAQQVMLEKVRPGVALPELNQAVISYYQKALKEIGLIEDEADVSQYYYHNVSHLLGLDTHDVGGREVVLEAGMVITCEPGLYIKEEEIGIRIEDDILVTDDGYENLSLDIMRSIEDIESFMAQNHEEK